MLPSALTDDHHTSRRARPACRAASQRHGGLALRAVPVMLEQQSARARRRDAPSRVIAAAYPSGFTAVLSQAVREAQDRNHHTAS